MTCEEIFKYTDKYPTEDEIADYKANMALIYPPQVYLKMIDDVKVTRDYINEYLRHVKVYDRDEAFEAMERLGDRLAGKMWDEKTIGQREEIIHRDPQHAPKNWDALPQDFKENIKLTLLHNPSTIYITTPRGGHEALSIFAYANDIYKGQIPSDIERPYERWEFYEPLVRQEILKVEGFDNNDAWIWSQKPWSDLPDHVKNAFGNQTKGRTWMDDPSNDIKRVVFVDDIVASGIQVGNVSKIIEHRLELDDVYGVHLCHRAPEHLYRPAPLMDKNREMFDTETIGIDEFDKRFKDKTIKPEDVVTCVFPWSIADGRADNIVEELYGDRQHTFARKERRTPRQP